jgi:uncharacterized phage protein (TIGR01671 family)
MRENKYKAFDRKTGDMFPVHEMQWNDKGELIFFKGRYDYEKDLYTVGGGNPNKMTGTANHEDGLVKRFEIIQYTGLKDADGIEIYEGDIVECEIGINKERYVGICEFNKRTASFEFGKKRTSSFGRTNMTVGRMKNKRVVGNIYENPELLGDSN